MQRDQHSPARSQSQRIRFLVQPGGFGSVAVNDGMHPTTGQIVSPLTSTERKESQERPEILGK